MKIFDSNKQKLQFLNSFYAKPRWKDGKMVQPDALFITYRDEETGKKEMTYMLEPTIDFYLAYEDVDIKYPLRHISKDLVEKCSCKFNDLPITLAKTAGEDMVRDFYDTMKKSPYQAKKKYHALPYVFNSDMDIEDFWKGKFLDRFTSEKDYLSKGYFDIEVDGIDYPSFPDEHEAPCPINAITYVDAESKTCYTFLLRNRNNPLIQEFENELEEFKDYLKTKLRDDFKYVILMFDSELALIREFYDTVNKCKPDFNLAWNMRFDKLTMLNRIDKLGGDKNDIICHKDFPNEYQFAYFNEDKKNQKASEKNDTFECASYTVYYDQLILYASLRKGMGERESYALNDVARDELNDEKLDYSDTGNIKTLPYENYKMFVEYNIKDVFLLYELENKNKDLEMLYMLAKTTRTRITKAMRKTISLKNMAVKFYEQQGYVIGNNHNQKIGDDKDDTPTEKFAGAVVADPNLNGYNGMLINGKHSKYVYRKVIDMDLSSLYPSIIRAFNIDTTTQYGRLFINNITPSKDYDPAMDFIDRLTTKNYIELGKDYYNMPSVTELARELINRNKED